MADRKPIIADAVGQARKLDDSDFLVVGQGVRTAAGLPAPVLAEGTANAVIALGEAVAISNVAGLPRYVLADADAGTLEGGQFAVGLANLAASGAGQPVRVTIAGEQDTPDTVWVGGVPTVADVGKRVFLAATPGKLTIAAPSPASGTNLRLGHVSRGGTGLVRVVVDLGEGVFDAGGAPGGGGPGAGWQVDGPVVRLQDVTNRVVIGATGAITDEKLRVTGERLRLEHALEMTDGAAVAVSGANSGRLRYNQTLNQFEQSSNGLAYAAFGGGGAGLTSLILWGDNSIAATTTTRFLTPYYSDGLAQTLVIQFRVPRAGTIRNLRVRQNQPAGNGNPIVYTVRVNNIATAITASVASTASDGSDLVNSVAIVAGDLIDIRVTKAAGVGTTPNDITATLEFA